MSSSKTPKPISGFPEWLPEVRRIEQQWLDILRTTFESYGFASIEPSMVEEVSTLGSKGEDVDKEIYALRRLNGEQKGDDPKLALHFDLTVPMARYVAQNYSSLQFPFKRYQIQKAWRGERPQEGRYREFMQADIDVIDNNNLSLHFDGEMLRIIHKVFDQIGVGVQTNINNRKIIQGFYEGLGITEPMQAIRIVDKIDKITPQGVREMLAERMALSPEVIDKCLELATIRATDSSFVEKIKALGVQSPLMEEGLQELAYVMDSLKGLPEGSVLVNMSTARGLDYYTGTVYEGKLTDYPEFLVIYAGGRYANLVGSYLNRDLPGVGISIGITRTVGKMLKEGRLNLGEKSPTDLLILRTQTANYTDLLQKAEILRDRGINVEIYHKDAKPGDQMKYADRKGIPFVMFAADAEKATDEVKNLKSGDQGPMDVQTWVPDNAKDTYKSTLTPSPKKSILSL